MAETQWLFEITELHHKYDKNVVFDGVNLKLERGHFYTILGENGAGKSTFMRLLSGLESFDSGSIKISGRDSIGEDFQTREPIALITEDLFFEINSDLETLVSYFSKFYPNWNQSKFDDYLKTRSFDLDRTFASMSRGQKVQFSLMLYLSTGVETFVVDEVTSVLDLYSRNFFLRELKNLVDKGGTVVFATNIISEVQAYTDHVIVFSKKKVSLNMAVSQVPESFVKLFKSQGTEHAIFDDQDCHWAGLNEDNTEAYVISKHAFSKYKDVDIYRDTRVITLSDIFVFYFKIDQEVENENAA